MSETLNQKVKDSIFFVIPSYNEAKSVPNVIALLNKEGYTNLIVIDDGSSDNTQEILNKKSNLNFTLLTHLLNRGQGAALKTGIEYATSQNSCKYIVTFDSDGQHRISDLPNLLQPVLSGKYDVSLGSRFLNKETAKLVPFKKRLLLKGAIFITFFLSSIHLTDVHNGYRVFTKNAAQKLQITLDGFEHASEILDEIPKKQLRYKEVPVHIDYTEYSMQKGQKMSNSIKIILKMLFR